jgi:undecaprenyl-diphosphatase
MRRRLWIVLVVSSACFVALAATYQHEPFASLDADVAKWVAADLPHAFELVARPFSWLGGWIGLTILGIGTALVLVKDRAWDDLLFLATALIGSNVAVAVLKIWFDRDRPDLAPAVPLPTSSSFPSGHAASGVAGLGAIAVLAAERLPSRRARVAVWFTVAILGIAVGLSRIALGVHFVTDVVAGWCFGLAWLAGCLLVRSHFAERDVSSAEP